MSENFSPRHLKLKKGAIASKVCDSIMAMFWKDERCMHAFRYTPLFSGNFLYKHGNATKPHVIEQYNTHMA
jgi:hypothetical protein